MSGFEGRSVLVFGGRRGIGGAIMRRFASDTRTFKAPALWQVDKYVNA